MLFKKRFKITFENPHNPNESMGEIFTFYSKENKVVAHLSLTWECRLWFAYADDNGEWKNKYFPMFFNRYSRGNDCNVIVDFSFDGKRVIWSQNDFIHDFVLEDRIFYQYVREFEESKADFFSIKNNNIVMSQCRLDEPVENIEQATFDVVVCAYKAFDWLTLCLHTLGMTYDANNNKDFVLAKIILMDNNSDKHESNLVTELVGEFKSIYNIELDYIKNDDNRYVANRATAVEKAVALSESDYILSIDSDTIFTSSEWVDTFNYYNEFPSIVGVGGFNNVSSTDRIRNAAFLCPRLTPHFMHFRSVYIKNKVSSVPDLFGDMDVYAKYKNVNIGLVGFHFSKILLEIFSDYKKYMITDAFPKYFVHAKARSFEEVHRKQMIQDRISAVVEAVQKRVLDPALLAYIMNSLESMEAKELDH